MSGQACTNVVIGAGKCERQEGMAARLGAVGEKLDTEESVGEDDNEAYELRAARGGSRGGGEESRTGKGRRPPAV